MHLSFTVGIHCRVTKCSKALRCYTGSSVIVMQLDRHSFGFATVQQHVAFPDELDLRPWMHPMSPELADDASFMYDLVSIVVHKGKTHSAGHYTAVCCQGPGEGICPLLPKSKENHPNLPQAFASVACTVCCASPLSDVTAQCVCCLVCCSLIRSTLAAGGIVTNTVEHRCWLRA